MKYSLEISHKLKLEKIPEYLPTFPTKRLDFMSLRTLYGAFLGKILNYNFQQLKKLSVIPKQNTT